jgi:eukaryotic-like serine/threonine-protein kinase
VEAVALIVLSGYRGGGNGDSCNSPWGGRSWGHSMAVDDQLLLGRYQVGQLLAYGGMTEVHRGRDVVLGRNVAIKILRPDLARDATFLERFRREAQNSAALDHPAIVGVYDVGEEISSTGERLSFIVMEFVDGQTLREVLATEQRLQQQRALEIIAASVRRWSSVTGRGSSTAT